MGDTGKVDGCNSHIPFTFVVAGAPVLLKLLATIKCLGLFSFSNKRKLLTPESVSNLMLGGVV